jgi:hypothetical protein
MSVSLKKVGSQFALGGDLDESQVKALSSISVNANDIFENLESLNDEIVESGYEVASKNMKLPTAQAPTTQAPVKKK